MANEPIPGAHGSLWITEIAGRNEGAGALEFSFPVCPLFECSYYRVPANGSFGSEPFPSAVHGTVVQVPYTQARDLRLSLRARDLSRALDTWGTEIPVVRESELEASAITLLNLPTGAGFRSLIRLYDFGAFYGDLTPRDFVVTVFPLDSNAALAEFSLTTQVLRGANESSQGIRFAVIGDLQLPEGTPDRVRVTIRASETTRFWAFASITNNETQHVTTVSPARERSGV